MSKHSEHTKWDKVSAEYQTMNKFLPKGKQILIFPNTEPKEIVVKGKWGDRVMYVVESEIGHVLLSPADVNAIVKLMNMRGDFTTPIQYPQ